MQNDRSKKRYGIILLLGLIAIALFFILKPRNNLFNKMLIGSWGGLLKTNSKNILVYTDFSLDSTDNISLKVRGLFKKKNIAVPADSLTIDNNRIKFSIKNFNIHFDGLLVKDSNKIKGTWQQGNLITPIVLYPYDELHRINRPQHPFKPFPYYVDTISFINPIDSIKLVGELTYPKKKNKKFPALVLLSGIGPHDRDETMYAHKPFLVIADYFTKKGYAVLRYDERGVGDSDGDFYNSNINDLILDAKAAITFLKTKKYIDSSRIGIIGFSEGAVVGSVLASQNDCSFLILMAMPALTGKELLLNQTQKLQEKEKVPMKEIKRDKEFNEKIFDLILNEESLDTAKEKISKLYKKFVNNLPEKERLKPKYNGRYFFKQLKVMLTPWFKKFLTFNPLENVSKIKCPVLLLYGSLDVQVDPEKNSKLILETIKKTGNNKIKVKIFDGLNHLFQKCKTGLPDEYQKIKQTISPIVLENIATWIEKI